MGMIQISPNQSKQRHFKPAILDKKPSIALQWAAYSSVSNEFRWVKIQAPGKCASARLVT